MALCRLLNRPGQCNKLLSQPDGFIIPVVLIVLSILAAIMAGLLTTARAELKSARTEYQVADNQVSEGALLQQASRIVNALTLADFAGAPDASTASSSEWRCNVEADTVSHSCLFFFQPLHHSIPFESSYRDRMDIPVALRWRGSDGVDHTAFGWVLTAVPYTADGQNLDTQQRLTVTEVISDHTWCYYDSVQKTCTQGG